MAIETITFLYYNEQGFSGIGWQCFLKAFVDRFSESVLYH
jgi:hypothetical protein